MIRAAVATFLMSGVLVSGAAAAGEARKSISSWVKCDGSTDDSEGVARAFDAAKNNSFTLVVDCPVRMKIGLDIDHTVYIQDGTAVEFTAGGKLTVDNILHPAFVIANSGDIKLINWNVQFDGSLPADWNVGGYARGGRFTAIPSGHSQPSNAFTDIGLTGWLKVNRGIIFDRSQGNVNARWSGATNCSAIFYLSGDVSHIRVTGMHMGVPANAGGERFIPVGFSLNPNYKSRQTVTSKTPITGEYLAVPHDLVFADIVMDGTYMGWVGTLQKARFENIRSHRYGDLQDAAGNNNGGVGKWFAPPHLFYLSYAADGDPALFNRDIRIDNVTDDGPRVGVARDKGQANGDSVSGYALSLKMGCVDCSVNHYTTNRPDGFMDVLPSERFTISNVTASYDSSFLNDAFPGWRFPANGYKNVTFENITLTDVAAASSQPPIGGVQPGGNDGIVFRNVRVLMHRWAGKGEPLPTIGGTNHNVALDYILHDEATQIVGSQTGSAALTLKAIGVEPVMLQWSSRNASGCTGSGALSGTLDGNGSRSVRASPGAQAGFGCQGPSGPLSVSLVLGAVP